MTMLGLHHRTWLRRFDSRPAATARLVCFPHAGGSATGFRILSARLGPAVETHAVQYPGHQDRRAEPLIDDLHALADQAAQALGDWAVRDGRPLALFGHSMGASVAYEVARRLEQRRDLVLASLFASGRPAPSADRIGSVHRLGDGELLGHMRRLDGTLGALLDDDELVRAMILPALRNDFRAAETYQAEPGPPLACPITALIGAADPWVTAGQAARWGDYTTGPFDLRTLAGGHFYIDAQADAVAELIDAALADNAHRPGARRP